MKVVVLYDTVPEEASPDHKDVLAQVEAVSSALCDLGYDPVGVTFSLDLIGIAETLRRIRPVLVRRAAWQLLQGRPKIPIIIKGNHFILCIQGIPFHVLVAHAESLYRDEEGECPHPVVFTHQVDIEGLGPHIQVGKNKTRSDTARFDGSSNGLIMKVPIHMHIGAF